MSKFKVGDRVKSLWGGKEWKNVVGTIRLVDTYYEDFYGVSSPYGYIVRWDNAPNNQGAHFQEEELELISSNHPLTSTIITDIKSEEQYRRVQEKLKALGNKPVNSLGMTPYNLIKIYPFGNFNSFPSQETFYQSECSDWPHVPASEFLGEEKPETKKIVFNCSSLPHFSTIDFGYSVSGDADLVKELNNYKYPTPSPRTGDGTIKRMLKTLSSTLKRVLSPALQSQYRAGYINGALELTDLGIAELLRLVAKDKEVELAASADEFIAEQEKESNKK